MKDDSLVNKIAEIIYKDVIGESDTDVPLDEYVTEARELINRLKNIDHEITDKDISIILTHILREYLDYDFTKYQLDEGTYNEVAADIRQLLENQPIK